MFFFKNYCMLKNPFGKLCQEFDSFTKRMTKTEIFRHMNGIKLCVG
jgi:hypothetical protein